MRNEESCGSPTFLENQNRVIDDILKEKKKREAEKMFFGTLKFDALILKENEEEFKNEIRQILLNYEIYEEAPDYTKLPHPFKESDLESVSQGYKNKYNRVRCAGRKLCQILILADDVARGKLSTAFTKLEERIATNSKDKKTYRKNMETMSKFVSSFIIMKSIF